MKQTFYVVEELAPGIIVTHELVDMDYSYCRRNLFSTVCTAFKVTTVMVPADGVPSCLECQAEKAATKLILSKLE